MYSILCELKEKITEGRISKINQPEKDELSILIRSKDNKNYRLLISASSSFPKIHLTEINKTNPLTAPMFCMVLRKYLLNSRILNIRQLDTDRVIIFDFESVDEMGFNSVYSLIVEVMGRHSNITLIRQRDNIIMDSIKHITPEINRFRSLYPGIEYVYPPKSEKLNPFEFTREAFINFIEKNSIPFDDKMCSKIFTGVSKTLSSEIMFRLTSKGELSDIDNIYKNIKAFFTAINEKMFSFTAYYKDSAAKDFYCIKLASLRSIPGVTSSSESVAVLNSLKEKEYPSASALLENFYFQKDRDDRLNNHSIELQRIVHTNLDRCSKKEEILKENLEECKGKDKYRLYGELLTANIYSVKKGDKSIEVQNYYSEALENIIIPLNQNKTPSENIQLYFKKYTKLKKTEEMAVIQLSANKEETEYLQSVFTNIKNAETYEEIEEIKKELIETGYIKFSKKNSSKKSKVSKPLHFVSSDGIDIFVGKNNYQNDYLTLKFADKRDIWMHTKNIPGSHVIVKNSGKIPDKTLEEAAALAAYYSKAKHSNIAEVDYTEVRNIKKPSGAKPGMVIYYTNKTINIMPKKIE